MKAIILAAGYATRLYPLTENCPKALLPVGGRTILDHLLSYLRRAPALDEVHIVSNHRFYRHLSDWAEGARAIYAPLKLRVWDDGTTSNENRLGAIGDIRFVIEQAGLDDDLFVAASDNLLDAPLDGLFEDFQRNGRDVLLCGRLDDRDECRRFAVLETSPEGRILSMVEKPEQPKTNIVAYAIYLYRRDTIPELLRYLEEGNNPDSPGHFPEWLHARREMRAVLYQGTCVDIGTVRAYTETCAEWERKKGKPCG